MNWRYVAAYLVAACAEVCWFTPWFMALTPGTLKLPAGPALAWVLGLILAPMALVRLLHGLRLKLRLQRWVLAGALLLTGLIALRGLVYTNAPWAPGAWIGRPLGAFADVFNILPEELAILLVVLFLWWRGLQLGQELPSVAVAGLRFRAGVVIFALLILMLGLGNYQDLTPFVVAFFFFGLLAVALARLEEVSRLRGGQAAPLGRSWLGVLGLATVTVIGAGAGLTALLVGPLPGQVMTWLGPLWIALIAVVAFVMSLIVLLLLALAQFVAGLIPTLDLSFVTRLDQFLRQLQGVVSRAGESVPSQVITVLGGIKGLVTMVCLGAILVSVVLALRQLRSVPSRRGETTESTLTATALASGLRALADEGVVGLARLARRFGLGRELLAALSIRRIYAQMAALAAAQGYPRAPSETPYEYLSSLAQAFPGGAEQTRRITEAYVGVHYGELPETPGDLAAIRAAWAELRELAREKMESRLDNG